jgi:hypothetical protein
MWRKAALVEALAVLKRSVGIIHHAWAKSFPLIMRHTSSIDIMLQSWDSVSGADMQTSARKLVRYPQENLLVRGKGLKP